MSDYAKGYAAGRRKRKRDNAETALWQRAYVSALPAAMQVQGWTRGQERIVSVSSRVKLAKEFADEALKQARIAGRV